MPNRHQRLYSSADCAFLPGFPSTATFTPKRQVATESLAKDENRPRIVKTNLAVWRRDNDNNNGKGSDSNAPKPSKASKPSHPEKNRGKNVKGPTAVLSGPPPANNGPPTDPVAAPPAMTINPPEREVTSTSATFVLAETTPTAIPDTTSFSNGPAIATTSPTSVSNNVSTLVQLTTKPTIRTLRNVSASSIVTRLPMPESIPTVSSTQMPPNMSSPTVTSPMTTKAAETRAYRAQHTRAHVAAAAGALSAVLLAAALFYAIWRIRRRLHFRRASRNDVTGRRGTWNFSDAGRVGRDAGWFRFSDMRFTFPRSRADRKNDIGQEAQRSEKLATSFSLSGTGGPTRAESVLLPPLLFKLDKPFFYHPIVPNTMLAATTTLETKIASPTPTVPPAKSSFPRMSLFPPKLVPSWMQPAFTCMFFSFADSSSWPRNTSKEHTLDQQSQNPEIIGRALSTEIPQPLSWRDTANSAPNSSWSDSTPSRSSYGGRIYGLSPLRRRSTRWHPFGEDDEATLPTPVTVKSDASVTAFCSVGSWVQNQAE